MGERVRNAAAADLRTTANAPWLSTQCLLNGFSLTGGTRDDPSPALPPWASARRSTAHASAMESWN